MEPAKNGFAVDARSKLIAAFHAPNELVSEIDVDFLILGTETVTNLTRHIAAHRPQRAAHFHEDIEVVLSLADRHDLRIVDELTRRKLDRSTHGENERNANEVVARLDPEFAQAIAGALVRDIVEGDIEKGELGFDVPSIRNAPYIFEEKSARSVASVEEVRDAFSIDDVSFCSPRRRSTRDCR